MVGLFFVLALLPLGSVAFSQAGPLSVRTGSLQAEKSKAVPFLPRPEKLDGSLVGDVGFDPLLITDTLPDLQYARTAELKNGRVAVSEFLYLLRQDVVFLR